MNRAAAMTRTLLVDLQGFKVNGNQFIFKEVAVLDCSTLTSPKLYGLVFDAPFPLQFQDAEERRQTRWIEHHLGHTWNEEGIPYELLTIVLKAYLFGADQVFVKGAEKRQWLQDFVSPNCKLIDLHELGCPSLKTLVQEQWSVTAITRRSLRHVCALFGWLCRFACRETVELCKLHCSSGDEFSEANTYAG